MYISLAQNVINARLNIIGNALGTNKLSTNIDTYQPNSESSNSFYGNSGSISVVFYTGPIPANADTRLNPSNVALAMVSIDSSNISQASNGTLVINGTPLTSSPAFNSGTATFARFYDGNGNNVMDCDVGISGTTIVLVSNNITLGLVITVTTMSFSES